MFVKQRYGKDQDKDARGPVLLTSEVLVRFLQRNRTIRMEGQNPVVLLAPHRSLCFTITFE